MRKDHITPDQYKVMANILFIVRVFFFLFLILAIFTTAYHVRIEKNPNPIRTKLPK